MQNSGWVAVGVVWMMFMGGCAAADAVEVGEPTPSEAASEISREGLRERNALSAAQSKLTLRLIDDICGDTWCSGDYNFAFKRLVCSESLHACSLTLQVFPREGVVTRRQSYIRSCQTQGFDGLASLVTTAPSGYQALAPAYYDALTECTWRITAAIH